MQRQVELGLEVGERRPELVTGIGDEPALALDGGLETMEHPIETDTQRGELIPAPGKPQAATRLGPGYGIDLDTHPLDGPERSAGDHPANCTSQQDRHQAGKSEQDEEPIKGLSLVVERHADYDDAIVGGWHLEDPSYQRFVGQVHDRVEVAWAVEGS